MAKNKERVFYDTLIKLNDFIDNSCDGDTLPGEVQLSQMFDVSRSTIRSVLAEAVTRGYIDKIPQKGHTVMPKRFRRKKIGLVIDSGRENPCVQITAATGALIQQLGMNYIDCQIIQSCMPERIPWRAIAHEVDALVWILAGDDLAAVITEANDEFPFPQVIISYTSLLLDKVVPEKISRILFDPKGEAKLLVDYFLQKGHKSIAFIGSMSEQSKDNIKNEMERSGFAEDKSFVVDAFDKDWEQELAELTRNNKYTAARVIGSKPMRERALEIISENQGINKPEIVLFDDGVIDLFLDKFKDLNITSKNNNRSELLGNVAAEKIIKYFNDKTPISSARVLTTSIEEINR